MNGETSESSHPPASMINGRAIVAVARGAFKRIVASSVC
jgi:hypothetical protein